jgi:hypothetical protein
MAELEQDPVLAGFVRDRAEAKANAEQWQAKYKNLNDLIDAYQRVKSPKNAPTPSAIMVRDGEFQGLTYPLSIYRILVRQASPQNSGALADALVRGGVSETSVNKIKMNVRSTLKTWSRDDFVARDESQAVQLTEKGKAALKKKYGAPEPIEPERPYEQSLFSGQR